MRKPKQELALGVTLDIRYFGMRGRMAPMPVLGEVVGCLST
jgi:hypothetical protein